VNARRAESGESPAEDLERPFQTMEGCVAAHPSQIRDRHGTAHRADIHKLRNLSIFFALPFWSVPQ
jgi:hypothetical protein